jgi:cyclophilin family peptidyl-prolyl cis-trans isomerase
MTSSGLLQVTPTKDTRPATRGSLKWFQLKEKQWRESPRKKVVPLTSAGNTPARPVNPSLTSAIGAPPTHPSSKPIPWTSTSSSVSFMSPVVTINPTTVESAVATTPQSTSLMTRCESTRTEITPSYRERLIELLQKYNPSRLDSMDELLVEFKGKEEVMFQKLEKKYAQPGADSVRERLMEFYKKYNPTKLSSVDETLAKFKGNEEVMFQKLKQKYVTGKEGMLQPSGRGPRCYLEFSSDGKHLGRLDIQLFQDKAPLACENFRCLCTGEKGIGRSTKQLCYRGSKIHRLVPGFVIQGGDFTKGDGTGGESIYAPNSKDGDMWGKFKDEQPFLMHSRKGLLSMANNGPNTNGSQFFITLTATPFLDAKHVVFGEVVAGLELVDELGKFATDQKQRPLQSLEIVDCGQLNEDGAVISSASSSQATSVHITGSSISSFGSPGVTSWQPMPFPSSGAALDPTNQSNSFGRSSLYADPMSGSLASGLLTASMSSSANQSVHASPSVSMGQGASMSSSNLNNAVDTRREKESKQKSTPAGVGDTAHSSAGQDNAALSSDRSKAFAIESAASALPFLPSASKAARSENPTFAFGPSKSTMPTVESATSSYSFGWGTPSESTTATIFSEPVETKHATESLPPPVSFDQSKLSRAGSASLNHKNAAETRHATESTKPSFPFGWVKPSECAIPTFLNTPVEAEQAAESVVPSLSLGQSKPSVTPRDTTTIGGALLTKVGSTYQAQSSFFVAKNEKKSPFSLGDEKSANPVDVSNRSASTNAAELQRPTLTFPEPPAAASSSSAQTPKLRYPGSKLASPSPGKPALPSFYFGANRPDPNISTACLSASGPLFASVGRAPPDIRRAKEVSEAVADILAERVFCEVDILSKVSVEQVEQVMALPVEKKIEVLEYIDHLEDQGRTFTWEDIESVSKNGNPFSEASSTNSLDTTMKATTAEGLSSQQGHDCASAPRGLSSAENDAKAGMQGTPATECDDDVVMVPRGPISWDSDHKATVATEEAASDEYVAVTRSPPSSQRNESFPEFAALKEQGDAVLVANNPKTDTTKPDTSSTPPDNESSSKDGGASDDWINVDEYEMPTPTDQLNDEEGPCSGEEVGSGWDDGDDLELLLLNLETLN